MSVVVEQKIQPQETPSETVAIRSARAVEAQEAKTVRKLLRRHCLQLWQVATKPDTYDGRRLLQSKYRSCSGRTGG